MNCSRSVCGLLVVLLSLGLATRQASAAIIVHALDFDYSTTNNPNGVWSYYNGNTLLSYHSPVPNPLPVGIAPGYWGQSAGNIHGAFLRTVADGNTLPPFTNSDFLNFQMLVRTADPGQGGPTRIVFTAPTAGQLTYGASLVWNANGPLGPALNDFQLTLNNGPVLESGTINVFNDLSNPVLFVNGFNLLSVQSGDQLILELQPSTGFPNGGLVGIGFTIDFTPVPEPSAGLLVPVGLLGLHRRRRGCDRRDTRRRA